MHKINQLASMVVWKGFGFSWLAICTAMSGLIFDLGPASLSFDLDVQIYSYVYPDKYDSLDTQIALVYVLGVGF